MTKVVARQPRITLGGVDVSNSVMGWVLRMRIGELYRFELDLIDDSRVIVIEDNSLEYYGRSMTNNADIWIKDEADDEAEPVNIARFIDRYERVKAVREYDVVRLFIQATADVLTINGTTPFVEPQD